MKKTPFEKVYISPNPGDAGGAIGSALYFLLETGQKIENNINYAYLGSNYSDEDIELVISKKDLKQNFPNSKVFAVDQNPKKNLDLLPIMFTIVSLRDLKMRMVILAQNHLGEQ